MVRLVSTQVLERCKLYAKGSHSLTLINECPACASYRLEFERPSPQARHRTTERSAVNQRMDQLAIQHGKGNSAQLCAHMLSSPKGHREKMSASGKMLPESLGLPQCQGELWVCCFSRQRAEDVSRVFL